jgi:DNA-3-methyladenine glycosylase II
MTLTPNLLITAADILAVQDADLAGVIARFGYPPLWPREPGFPTLLKLILEQQVSLASAQAAYDRLLAVVGELTPESLLVLDDETLRGVGFSRQKARYGRLLAEAVQSGSLDMESLPGLDDESVRVELQKITGIGPWTAEVYLLMVLLRPDVWPRGDIALATAAQQVKGLAARPSQNELHDLAEQWRPWRAVAARILWHHYLSISR